MNDFFEDEVLDDIRVVVTMEEKYEKWYCKICGEVHDPCFNCSRAYFKSIDRRKKSIDEAIKIVREKFNLKH